MANSEINDLTNKTTPLSTDEVELQATGGGTSNKATVGNLAKGMSYNDLNDKPTIPSGDVAGPASATDRAIALFDSTTGKLIKNSSVLIDSDGAMTGVSDITMASGSVLNASSLGTIRTNQLLESTPASGVTIDGVLIKDGLVDGIDIATDVAANTAKVGITPTQAANITTNNAKISYTDGAKVAGIETGATANPNAIDGSGVATVTVNTTAPSSPATGDLWVDTDDATDGSIAALAESVGNLLMPVGFIYVSGVATNPNTLLGFGTWTQIEGKFIAGVSTSDTDFDLDDTGGAKTVTLTSSQVPDLTVKDSFNRTFVYGTGASGSHVSFSGFTTGNSSTGAFYADGGGGSHENLPPYIAKYIWQRTA